MLTRSNLSSIPGWLRPDDEALLRFVLDEQNRQEIDGDLAEMGVYMGKSAVLLADYLLAGQTFTVVDLFEEPAGDRPNTAENARHYDRLSEDAFRSNFQRFHKHLPVIVKGASSALIDRARHGAHRLVHVDASHLYEHVRSDVDTARALLHPQGIAVFDDYRSRHTPGTAAAVWEAVDRTGLVPLVLTDLKFYGMWGDPTEWHERFARWISAGPMASEKQVIAGHPVLRVWSEPTRRRVLATAALPPALLSRFDRVIARRTAGRG